MNDNFGLQSVTMIRLMTLGEFKYNSYIVSLIIRAARGQNHKKITDIGHRLLNNLRNIVILPIYLYAEGTDLVKIDDSFDVFAVRGSNDF